MVEDKKFIDMCAVCKQGVTKLDMVYQKGRVFHPRCYETQGNNFPAIDQDLAQLSARTRIELVQMKNLKVRSDTIQTAIPEKEPKQKPKKKAKRKTKVKPKKKSVKKTTRKSKQKKIKKSKKAKKPASKRRR